MSAISLQTALSNLSRSLESYFFYISDSNLSVASASEITSETKPDVVIFQYKIDDVFEDAKMLSANLAKYAATEKADLFDMITVTTEDQEMFTRFLKSAALYAYTKIQGLAKSLDNALLFDEGSVISDWATATPYVAGTLVKRNSVIYKALADVTSDPEIDTDNWEEMPDYVDTLDKITYNILYSENFDSNVIKVWDDNLKDIIVMYTLEKMFKFRNLPAEIMSIVIDERTSKEIELVRTINSRKQPVKRYVAWM